MLKSGGPAKDSAILWMKHAIVCNAENEKDRPSAQVGASRGFMLNLSSVLLQLVKPFVSDDTDKLKKVDLRYLLHEEGRELHPPDATPLMTLSTSTSTAASTAVPGEPKAKDSTEAGATTTTAAAASAAPNFMTQSFFMCSRALHLGYAPMCRDYERLLRSLYVIK